MESPSIVENGISHINIQDNLSNEIQPRDSGASSVAHVEESDAPFSDTVDSCDPEFASTEHTFVAFEQSEDAGHHYLRIVNNQLRTDGKQGDPATLFRLHITDSQSYSCVVVIEGIEASKNGEPSLIKMNLQKNNLELEKKQESIARIKNVPDSVLFDLKYKVENSHEIVYLENHEGKEKYCIGFSPKGDPLPPKEVKSNSTLSWFILNEM